jgi:hypothetical protein
VGPASGSEPPAGGGSPDLPQPWDPAFVTTLAPQQKASAGFMYRDMGAKAQAAFGALALQLYGEPIPESYSHDFLKSIVLHEVGTSSDWRTILSDTTRASDEDVESNGHAVDPRIAQFILTKDDIAWCGDQLDIDSGLIETLDKRFPHAREPWDQERVASSMLLRQYGKCTQAMTHYVAGEYLSRAHRGDPGTPRVRNARHVSIPRFGLADLAPNAASHDV